jgi:hypothetical protein
MRHTAARPKRIDAFLKAVAAGKCQ